MESLYKNLLNKSIEAFILSVEIYNKPTIRYRVEGFSFFICNAWELMLKAYILKSFGESELYYKDNPERTITLENCVKKIFTNDKDPLRKNIEKIVELRNISTHFVTQEYEMLYIPLFQSCIFNFNEKMKLFHDIDMTDHIPQNFLTLAISMKAIDLQEIRVKYPEEISTKFENLHNEISTLTKEMNSNFSIRIDHYHILTKDKTKATSVVYIDKEADTGIKVLNKLQDPNETHKYNAKACISLINKYIIKNNLPFNSYSTDETKKKNFSNYHFSLFTKYFKVKENPKLCYIYKTGSQPLYSYSLQCIEFIIDEIKKDPENIVLVLKQKMKKS
ncbi:MAG: DUF3644 domain-containing protein [Fusobacterium varium]|uniref:DUF3644 domain-containing protein n=1 Tax=Fusobacterium varium TaxID=856 RepID=UPI00242F9EE8|nr:DUF3644 domain-containing protein [Fusobacterium varium]MCF0169056.1 DUF3644 domain-containing protein [Fusobacterium varium]